MTQHKYSREQALQAYDELVDAVADRARSNDVSHTPTAINEAMDDVLHTAPYPEMDQYIIVCGRSEPDKREARRHYIDSENPTDEERRFGWARTVMWSDVRNRL